MVHLELIIQHITEISSINIVRVMVTRIQPVGMVTVLILVGRVMKLSNRITALLLVSNKIIWL